MRTLVAIWLSTLAWMTASVVAAQDTPPEAVPMEATSVEAVPVESAPVDDTSEPEVSAVPSGLADAQWGALPDDAALEATVEPEATDDNPSDNELTIGGRVIAGFQVRDRRPAAGQPGGPGSAPSAIDRYAGTDYGFVLQQARLRAELRPNKRLRIVVSADFADSPSDAIPYLRNAYLNFELADRWLEFRAGRFKRPFSRLELTSTGTLPLRGRGLGNQLIVENGYWGERAVGVMLRGRVKPADLRWWFAATNPNAQIGGYPEGLDLIARVTYEPIEWLSLGVSGAHKWTRHVDGDQSVARALGFGVDARVRHSGFELLTELLVAEQTQLTIQPRSMGLVMLASYEVPLSKNLRLQPTLFGEWADADIEFSGDDALRAVFGAHLLWKKSFRVMPQLELIRPLGTVTARNPWVESDRFMLVFSGQM